MISPDSSKDEDKEKGFKTMERAGHFCKNNSKLCGKLLTAADATALKDEDCKLGIFSEKASEYAEKQMVSKYTAVMDVKMNADVHVTKENGYFRKKIYGKTIYFKT